MKVMSKEGVESGCRGRNWSTLDQAQENNGHLKMNFMMAIPTPDPHEGRVWLAWRSSLITMNAFSGAIPEQEFHTEVLLLRDTIPRKPSKD